MRNLKANNETKKPFQHSTRASSSYSKLYRKILKFLLRNLRRRIKKNREENPRENLFNSQSSVLSTNTGKPEGKTVKIF